MKTDRTNNLQKLQRDLLCICIDNEQQILQTSNSALTTAGRMSVEFTYLTMFCDKKTNFEKNVDCVASY